MGEEDQRFRDYERIMRMEDSEQQEFLRRGGEADRRHARRLAEIIDEHGWPDRSRFGPEAARAAFLIVQHADHDPEWQAEVLPMLEEAAGAGTIDRAEYAYLVDRVRVAADRPQVYGTQYGVVKNELGQAVADESGNLQYLPPIVEDPEHLDRRRAEMDMGPWAEYDRQMAQQQNREPFAGPRSMHE